MSPPSAGARVHPTNPADEAPETLIGHPILNAWVPTAVASTGTACQVLRAEPVDGESKVLVHVIRLPEHETAAEGAAEALGSELETLRRVRHTGVLPLLMAGRMPDGRYVLVTPSTGSSTLASTLATRPPRLPATLRIAVQIARALKAIHDSVGVYGPLTPEHVLISPDSDGTNETRLLPVWWAWRHGRDDAPAAPWQPKSQVHTTRRMADDVYALGALIFHAVAGRPPREEDALETLTGGPVPPVPLLSSMSRRAIPPEVDALVASMLSNDPNSRPTDLASVALRMEDMVHQLEGGGAPPIAPPMITATPVPVGGQLRQRSLVLPVPPPEATEDPPTEPTGSRALIGHHPPKPRVHTESPPPERESRPAPLQMMAPSLPGTTLEDAPTIVEDDDEPNDVAAVAQTTDPRSQNSARDPAPAAELTEATSAVPPWALGVGAIVLLGVATVAALYLAGVLG